MADDSGVANGLASEDMDNVTHCSVVLHVDLDCFYAAVEQVRLGIPKEVPLAVQQWRGLIAINYPARAAGITRHERADQALKKCPELQLVHVETIGEEGGSIDAPKRSQAKVSLERYRQASASVFSIFRRFSDVYEKASIDEAYLDVTAKVEEMIKHGCNWDQELQRLIEDNGQGCATMVVLDGPLVPFNSYDRRMLAGAIIADRIRTTVRNELGYTCSVGIATNKLLAKIASAKNKPDRQTVIPPRAVPDLMQTIPLKKMRLLGGKLGEELTKKWGFSTAGEVQALSLTTLVSSFGERLGNYVWHAVRGIQADKVQPKQVPKSMLAAKSFGATKELSDVRRWLGILAEELAVRMLQDYQQNNRHPRLLQLYYRSGGYRHAKDHSKSWPMPHGALTLLSSSSVVSHQTSETFQLGKDPLHQDEQEYTVDLANEDSNVPGILEQQNLPADTAMAEDLGEEHSGLGLQVTERSKALGRVLEDAAYNMFKRLEGTFPCTRLALAASGFQELGAQRTKSIQHFFSNTGVGTSDSISWQNNQKPNPREPSTSTHSSQKPDTREASTVLPNDLKPTTKKPTTPVKPKGILKFLHHASLMPAGEVNRDALVTTRILPERKHVLAPGDGPIQLSKERHVEDKVSLRSSTGESPVLNTVLAEDPTREGALNAYASSSVADLSSTDPSEASGEIPDPMPNQARGSVANDGVDSHDSKPEGSSDASAEKPESSSLNGSKRTAELGLNKSDKIDLEKVNMKEQVRILADLQHSADQVFKSENQVRSQVVNSSAKRRRQSSSLGGQQSIGKFFHTQGNP